MHSNSIRKTSAPVGRAGVAAELGDPDAASRLHRRVLPLSRRLSRLIWGRASLFEHAGDYRSATFPADYSQIIRYNLNDGVAYFSRNAYRFQGRA